MASPARAIRRSAVSDPEWAQRRSIRLAIPPASRSVGAPARRLNRSSRVARGRVGGFAGSVLESPPGAGVGLGDGCAEAAAVMAIARARVSTKRRMPETLGLRHAPSIHIGLRGLHQPAALQP